jgi:hypothetical protein
MNEPTTSPTRLPRWLWAALIAAVLVLVLIQYRNPHFLVNMADQVWGCF